MKKVELVILGILVFLAVSSGLTKVALMEQDVVFFGKYGFTNPLLIGFGAIQVVGGAMLIFAKTRLIGASLVAVTFAISAVMLFMDSNVPVTMATIVALVFLGLTIKRSLAR